MESGPVLPPAPPAGDDDTPAGLPGRGGSDGFGGFGRSFLSDGVGRGQANKPEDVHRVSGFLAGNGILPAPTDTADEDFFRAVEKGQDRLNELAGGGRRRDGIVKPWGPTEVLGQRAVSSGRMKAPDEPKARIDLPPPYTDIPPPGPAAPPRPKDDHPASFRDQMQDLLDLLAKRKVEYIIPVGPNGKPDDRNAVNLRDDTLERLTRIFDNLLSVGTLLKAPTFFESTVKPSRDNDGGA
ncbi:hypothetical protein RJ527_08835 [Thalassospiraceae bacterium LMO-SO8]|nr:hypothetical protein [Alphaproteobacteria bacterium LMO-S08]WND77836.1 hypothetical protein RJ527_08835 [Thalassospiraceae bacterium LMO-SO8]